MFVIAHVIFQPVRWLRPRHARDLFLLFALPAGLFHHRAPRLGLRDPVIWESLNKRSAATCVIRSRSGVPFRLVSTTFPSEATVKSTLKLSEPVGSLIAPSQ